MKIAISGHGGHLCEAYSDHHMQVGSTIEEAIGRLITNHPEDFGIEISLFDSQTTAYERSDCYESLKKKLDIAEFRLSFDANYHGYYGVQVYIYCPRKIIGMVGIPVSCETLSQHYGRGQSWEIKPETEAVEALFIKIREFLTKHHFLGKLRYDDSTKMILDGIDWKPILGDCLVEEVNNVTTG